MSKYRILKPTKQKLNNKKLFGFDIETYGQKNDFLLASIVGENYEKLFYTKEEFIKEIRTNTIFKDSIIYATNLGFDFFGIYFNEGGFRLCHRGGRLLSAKSFFYKKKFQANGKVKTKSLKSITFIDSMNYAMLSVKEMGENIGMPKLEHPFFLGKMPKNEEEWEIMRKYNIQDSTITLNFMIRLKEGFELLGATMGMTLASTSMSLFKNKYLDKDYILPSSDNILEHFKSYYGGRTEAFKKGVIRDYYYYDFNSLYPSVMRDNVFPNPSTLRISSLGDLNLIELYEGCSDVLIECPYMRYPLLPYRKDNGRVIFPYGKFRGWYTHIELREALKLGYKIIKIFKTHYFSKVCKPFESFVNDLYELRKKYKKEKSIMQYVIKITMNSLYGKFGQRFLKLDNWIHESLFDEKEFLNTLNIETIGNYVRVTKNTEPSTFCIPIWASYVTAYGRLKLYNEIIQHNPVYVDTDSLLIDHEIKSSDKLGDVKLEKNIVFGFIVRPKFYATRDSNGEEEPHIKGLGTKINFQEFENILINPVKRYTKFAKFKEALRRGLVPNEIIDIEKNFSLEDEKREWKGKFNKLKLQDSEPLYIEDENEQKENNF